MQYLVGSAFGLVSAATPDDENQVSAGDLKIVLGDLFESARDNLELLGRLALGNAREGEEYEWLPHSDGSGPLELTSPIAGFFADGKMLATDGYFKDTIEHGFGQFKNKIIDQALVSGGLQVRILPVRMFDCVCDSPDRVLPSSAAKQSSASS